MSYHPDTSYILLPIQQAKNYRATPVSRTRADSLIFCILENEFWCLLKKSGTRGIIGSAVTLQKEI